MPDLRTGSPPPLPEEPVTAASLLRIDTAAATHPGHARKSNQDHYLVARFSRGAEVVLTNLASGLMPARFEESAWLLMVADGLGGHRAGELASELAVQLTFLLGLTRSRWNLRLEAGIDDVIDRVRDIIQDIDREIGRRGQEDQAARGMGTTLTCALAVSGDLFTFHVGDSRAYLLRRNQLSRLTRDQTWAQLLIDIGCLPPAPGGGRQPGANSLTAAVGHGGGQVEPDVHFQRLEVGDQLLVCSDGLTRHVDDAALAERLAAAEGPQQAVDSLIETALAAGGLDNVTAVVGRVCRVG